ncbi:hypothetical protein RFI_24214, partial [Reticulomyxa filosa]
MLGQTYNNTYSSVVIPNEATKMKTEVSTKTSSHLSLSNQNEEEKKKAVTSVSIDPIITTEKNEKHFAKDFERFQKTLERFQQLPNEFPSLMGLINSGPLIPSPSIVTALMKKSSPAIYHHPLDSISNSTGIGIGSSGTCATPNVNDSNSNNISSPTSLQDWHVSDVLKWLMSFPIGNSYLTEFARSGINGCLLEQLDDCILQSLGKRRERESGGSIFFFEYQYFLLKTTFHFPSNPAGSSNRNAGDGDMLFNSCESDKLAHGTTQSFLVPSVVYRCFYCSFLSNNRSVCVEHMNGVHKSALACWPILNDITSMPQFPYQTWPSSKVSNWKHIFLMAIIRCNLMNDLGNNSNMNTWQCTFCNEQYADHHLLLKHLSQMHNIDSPTALPPKLFFQIL